MILLTEFAVERNERADTIRKYISRHKNEFEGHCSISGTKMELDDVAVELLDKVYPLPKPVEIIEDTESRNELLKTQKLVIQLQQKISEQSMALAQAEAAKLLLEDKEEQLKEKKDEIEERKAELNLVKQEVAAERSRADAERERADAERIRAEEALKEVERLKSRSFFQRLFNK